MVGLKPFDGLLKGFVDAVGKGKKIKILRRHHAPPDELIEVDDAVPEFLVIEDDGKFLGQFPCLDEGERLKEFVHGAETSGKNDQGFGVIKKVKFPDEEIMELETEFRGGIFVDALLEGQADAEGNGLSVRFMGASIGSFHDAGASAGADHEAFVGIRQGVRPSGEKLGEFTGGVVGSRSAGGSFVARIFRGRTTGRTEEYDGIGYLVLAKAFLGFHQFAIHAYRACLGAVEKFVVAISSERFDGHDPENAEEMAWGKMFFC